MKWFCKHQWQPFDIGEADVSQNTYYHARGVYFLRCVKCQKIIAKSGWSTQYSKPEDTSSAKPSNFEDNSRWN
jgi:hypothetical protein